MRGTTIFKITLFMFALILTVGLAAGFYVLNTVDGLRRTTQLIMEQFIPAKSKSIGKVDGTWLATAHFENVEFTGLRGLPPGSMVKIQELNIRLHGVNIRNAGIGIVNARVKLPVSENIILNATIDRGRLSAEIFSPVVDVEELLALIPGENLILKSFKGSVRRLDLQITGTLGQPHIQGPFTVEKLTRPDLSLTQSPGRIDLSVEKNRPLRLKGEIMLDQGSVEARKTTIQLKPSRLYFSGNPKNPSLSLEGYSVIQQLEITLLVEGTVEKPQLKATSDPPLSYEEIMITLATGRRWEGIEALEQGEVSPQLAREFLGYLFFSGSDDGFLQSMGISDIRLTLDGDTKGFGFRKEVSDRLNLDFDIEQKGIEGQQNTAKTVGADYRVSNAFYATVERRSQIADGLNTTEPGAVDDRLLMKYKTRF